MLAALRSGAPADIAEALAQLRGQGHESHESHESHETHEAHDPPNPLARRELCDPEPQFIDLFDLSERCWRDPVVRSLWLTDFPPPEGFTGYQRGEWGDEVYERHCSAEEMAILEAEEEAARDAELAEQEDLRDAWFASLADDDDDEDEDEDAEDEDSDEGEDEDPA